MIGKKFGDFLIKEEIGKGGMGTVYKARQISLKRDVAIKILRSELSYDKEFVERFIKETLSIASLKHTNIIQIFLKGKTDEGIPFFAMEYVDGEDLSSKIKRGCTFSEEEAIDIIIQVCQGLESTSGQNIIHRDIKPSNLMITRDGIVKIADFGLAKNLDETTMLSQQGVFMGTVPYSSPEQGTGKPVDHRTDIYSLGIVLYQLSTNRVPFEGKDPTSVIYKHVHEKPVSPRKINSGLSSQIETVVLKAIAKKPEDRYQSMKEFREELEAVKLILSDNKEKSKKTINTGITSTARNIYREKRELAVIATILILLISGYSLYAFFGRGTHTKISQENVIRESADFHTDNIKLSNTSPEMVDPGIVLDVKDFEPTYKTPAHTRMSQQLLNHLLRKRSMKVHFQSQVLRKYCQYLWVMVDMISRNTYC
ncbi:MAG: protein kinase domain-containing protein [Planctomycetota bacterium]|jgi:serine/threonine-protein kinase